MDPEEEDCGPAGEAMHLFPHVVVAGAHCWEGEHEDVDQKDVEGYGDEEAAESDAFEVDIVLDSDDGDVEQEEPDDGGDAGAGMDASEMVEFCDDAAESEWEALGGLAE